MKNPSVRTVSQRTGRGLWIIAVVVLLIQLVLLSFSFPLSAALSGKFPWHIDGPYHVYQLDLGRALLKQGALTGLDPFFGAGHLGGVTYNVSARLPVLVSALLPETLSSATLYSAYVLLSALLAPLAVIVLARQLRWPVIHTAIAAFIGLAFWWIGAMRWYHTAGMASFVCASYLSAAYGAWIWRICTRIAPNPVRFSILLAGMAGGVGLWFHPLFGVLVAPWFLALLICNFREIIWRPLLLRAVPIAAIALALNLPWIMAMLGSPNIANDSPYQKAVGVAVAVKPLIGLWSNGGMGSLLNPFAALVCVVGLARLTNTARRQIASLFGTGVFLLLFAAFGAASAKIGILQPNRFVAPAFLFMGLGAAYCLGEAALRLRVWPRLTQIATGAAVLLFIAYAGREIYREATPGPHGHYGVSTTELTDTPALVGELTSWIRQNTSEDGRILFETSLGRIHGGGHTAGMLATATGREFIGAPYPYSLAHMSFWDNAGMGKPIGTLTPAELMDGLDFYNVGWIVAHSPALIALAARAEFTEPVARLGPVVIFKVKRALSFVASGTGNVRSRGFNRIDVDGAAGPALTLRYVWMPGLVTTPRAQIEPVQIKAGMPALIRVRHPPGSFTISVCARCEK